MLQRDTTKRIIATPMFLYITVLVGGAIGATLRYFLLMLFPNQAFPQTTLIINFVGCYVIHLTYQWLGRRVHIPYAFIRGMGVGFIGAFTTLAAFNIECLSMLQNGQFNIFALYMGVTIFVTFLASLLGMASSALLLRRRIQKLRKRQRELHALHQTQREAEEAGGVR